MWPAASGRQEPQEAGGLANAVIDHVDRQLCAAYLPIDGSGRATGPTLSLVRISNMSSPGLTSAILATWRLSLQINPTSMKSNPAFGLSTLVVLSAALSPAVAGTQPAPPSAQAIDMMRVAVGTPFPEKPEFPHTSVGDPLPSFTFAAPNTSSSKAPFADYQISIWTATGVVSSVQGSRPLYSQSQCKQLFDSLVQTTKEVYQLDAVSSEYSRFKGGKGDLRVEIRCTYSAGSPYIDLVFQAYSKTLSEAFLQALRKN